MLRFPPPLAPQSFLDRYWQKQPLALPRAMPGLTPFIDADELAWLATLEDVESRLVLTRESAGGSGYRVEQGPFSERRLARLPAGNWTLLVHDVDKHLPAFRRHFDAVPFIPDWRIDDLMISVAAPGGGVGPHRDRYDVFLCQAEGVREWRLADPSAAVPRRRRSALALLEPFPAQECVRAAPSDVLYLPPGVPHWGVAIDRCTTWSIGMRAPRRAELRERFGSTGGDRLDERSDDPCCDEPYYKDADLDAAEAAPGMISPQAVQRAAALLERSDPGERTAVATALGECVTEPKSWLAPERPAREEVAALCARLAQNRDTGVHGMARLGWASATGGRPMLFVNGSSIAVEPFALEAFRRLCAERVLSATACGRMLCRRDEAALLRWLVATGTFDLDSFR